MFEYTLTFGEQSTTLELVPETLKLLDQVTPTTVAGDDIGFYLDEDEVNIFFNYKKHFFMCDIC